MFVEKRAQPFFLQQPDCIFTAHPEVGEGRAGDGHNGAGPATRDDGLVIDLALLKGLRVDPATRTVSGLYLPNCLASCLAWSISPLR